MYVILNMNEYLDKINEILSNTEKFVKIKKDPSTKIKSNMHIKKTYI